MMNQSFYSLVICILIIFALASQSYSKNNDFTVASDTTQNELKGEIQSKKGKTIIVSITSISNLPEVNTTGILSKYFEEEILGFYTHGYFDIAEVEVISVTESEVTLSLLKELTNIKVNGKKENHFKKGVIVKFTW